VQVDSGCHGAHAQARAISASRFRERFAKARRGCVPGEARFAGPDTVEVADKPCASKRVIATGARLCSRYPGLAEAGYLTNETVFNLTQSPARFAIIVATDRLRVGAGLPALGSQVSLLQRMRTCSTVRT